MKIIDLLNKIANDEEVPEHIHIRDLDTYSWQKDVKAYWSDKDENNLLSDLDLSSTDLKEHIEIIEEEKKIPEKLDNEIAFSEGVCSYHWSGKDIVLKDKINEIIDYLESKGE